jgi:hypothetical protein
LHAQKQITAKCASKNWRPINVHDLRKDKPAKDPDMFAVADLMLRNASDLLPHRDFDAGNLHARDQIGRQVAPSPERLAGVACDGSQKPESTRHVCAGAGRQLPALTRA